MHVGPDGSSCTEAKILGFDAQYLEHSSHAVASQPERYKSAGRPGRGGGR